MEWDERIKKAAEDLSRALTEAARKCPYEFDVGLERFGSDGQSLTHLEFQLGHRGEVPHATSYSLHVRERGDRKIC